MVHVAHETLVTCACNVTSWQWVLVSSLSDLGAAGGSLMLLLISVYQHRFFFCMEIKKSWVPLLHQQVISRDKVAHRQDLFLRANRNSQLHATFYFICGLFNLTFSTSRVYTVECMIGEYLIEKTSEGSLVELRKTAKIPVISYGLHLVACYCVVIVYGRQTQKIRN
jgi:hypothetical protein